LSQTLHLKAIKVCSSEINVQLQLHHALCRGPRGRDRMVVGFTTTYAISAYHHWLWA